LYNYITTHGAKNVKSEYVRVKLPHLCSSKVITEGIYGTGSYKSEPQVQRHPFGLDEYMRVSMVSEIKINGMTTQSKKSKECKIEKKEI